MTARSRRRGAHEGTHLLRNIAAALEEEGQRVTEAHQDVEVERWGGCD
jgi:hypothetical protein